MKTSILKSCGNIIHSKCVFIHSLNQSQGGKVFVFRIWRYGANIMDIYCYCATIKYNTEMLKSFIMALDHQELALREKILLGNSSDMFFTTRSILMDIATQFCT